MNSLLLDARAALRFFLRRKMSALAAVATLGLALGANTAVFTVLNAFLFSSLGVPDAARVHQIASVRELPGRGAVEFYNAWPACELLSRESRAFAAVGAVQFGDFVWERGDDGEPRRLLGARATASAFDVWRAQPVLGRVLRAEEEGATAARVVVISHRLWQSSFGGRADVLGATMRLSGVPHEIVGVLPAQFSLPPDTDVWLPQEISADLRARGHGAKLFAVYARLAQGTSAAAAQDELRRLSAQLVEMDAINREWSLRSRPLRDVLLEGADRTVLLIQAGAVVLLLLAAANVAALQLAWAAERQTETAVRLAIGAPVLRLVRQFLTQSLLLAATGGVLGLLLAVWSLPLWQRLNPSPDLAFLLANTRLDFSALLFSSTLVLFSGLLAGLLPAWQTYRANLADALKSGARHGSASRSNLRSQQAMSQVQMAFAVLALTCAVLVGWSFHRLQSLSLGIPTEQRAVFRLQLPAATYPTGAERARFAGRLLEELQRRPEIRAAGLTTTLPVDDVRQRTGFAMEDAKGVFTEEAVPLHTRGISAGYLAALGVPLRAGRALEPRDLAPAAERVALVSETIARKYWPGASPLGRRVRRVSGGNTEFFQIVGVVQDIQDAGVAGPPGETIYLPLQFTPNRKFSVLIHGESVAAALAAGRVATKAADQTLAVFATASLDELAARANALPRLQSLLLGLFAAVATGITALGAYGIAAQLAAARGREYAVRLALGAQPRQLLRATLERHLRLGLAGALAGAALALLVGQALGRTLYGVSDAWWIYPAVAFAVLGLQQIVCLIPAWRAMRVDVPRTLAGD